jgi:hypothetical protein
MNPDTIDGHWRIVGVDDGRLVRTPYPAATYGLLSRVVRPWSTVHPLAPRPGVGRRAHVHATAFTSPCGGRTLLLVNDHPDEEREVELTLPAGWGGLPSSCRRVSGGVLDEPFAPRMAAPTGASARVTVPPMALLAWHDGDGTGG